MKSETAAFFLKSREFLDKAQGMLDIDGPTRRDAALISRGCTRRGPLFERGGEIAKSHKRARAEFGRLIKDDPRFDAELRAFLGRACGLKAHTSSEKY